MHYFSKNGQTWTKPTHERDFVEEKITANVLAVGRGKIFGLTGHPSWQAFLPCFQNLRNVPSASLT